ncbi:4-coumarate--CoA ligase 1 [Diachasma alloeum]|uniref:4-coumarate--CoA ligase 1 n=1 Tax=Diachasma alloeum TaxID=454923 RepID=UPI0007382C46|nr:4-coumarate--CoA ligase 1 [Diachasma alloeum]
MVVVRKILNCEVPYQKKTGLTYEDGIWKGECVEHPEGHWRYGEKILRCLRDYPDRIGQVDAKTGEEDTLRNIEDRSVKCALWMKKQGVKPGDIIALCTHNQLNSAIPLLASLFLGAVCNPWWETYLEEDLIIYFLNHTEPKVIFTNEESGPFIQNIVKKVQSPAKVIVLGKVPSMQSLQEILDQQNNEQVQSFECERIETADQPAMLIYTSGSTGRPKSVLLSYGSLTAGVGNTEVDGATGARGFWGSSFCWISAVIGMMICFVKGATAVVYPAPSEADICRLIEKYKINWIILGTGSINRLCNTEEASTCDMSSVDLLFFSGAIVKHDIEKFLLKTFPNASIHQVYGATEFGGAVTISKITDDSKPGTCGKITNNVEIKVIDRSTGKILGPNEEGEICVKSPFMMQEYFKNPEATAFVLDSEGWYHSDDLGYYDEDGSFYIIDRLKELIKCKLFDIAPGPIEQCIGEHPCVAEVAVIAKPYTLDREQPMAFVTKLPGKEVSEKDIIELVESKLSDRMRLSGGVKFLDQMPYTASGKIAKKKLRDLARLIAQE